MIPSLRAGSTKYEAGLAITRSITSSQLAGAADREAVDGRDPGLLAPALEWRASGRREIVAAIELRHLAELALEQELEHEILPW